MLDFEWLANRVSEAKKLYDQAQSNKDDATKQAMTVLVYDTLIADFESAIEVCQTMKEQHRASGIRILTDLLRGKK